MLVVILRSECDNKLPYAGVRFEKIIDYVKENCREAISLSEVAKRFFCQRRAPEPNVSEKHGVYFYAVCELPARDLCTDAIK